MMGGRGVAVGITMEGGAEIGRGAVIIAVFSEGAPVGRPPGRGAKGGQAARGRSLLAEPRCSGSLAMSD